MATTGVRITVRNVRQGGYILIREQHAGYDNSEWREDHRQAFGWGQEDKIWDFLRASLNAGMVEEGQADG